MMFCVFLHFGTILAIVIYYLMDIWDMIYQLGAMSRGGKRAYPAVRLLLLIVVSSLPLFLMVFLSKFVDTLFYSSLFIGLSLILSGTILYISGHFDNLNKDEKNLSLLDAFIIGICQIVSSIPGISRIATVSSASMAVGCKRDFSLKYAYLLSIPSLFGVNILHLVQSGRYGFSWSYLPSYLVGMAVSFAISYLAIKITNSIIKNGNFNFFAYYDWVAGVLFIILTMIF